MVYRVHRHLEQEIVGMVFKFSGEPMSLDHNHWDVKYIVKICVKDLFVWVFSQ